MAECLQDLLQCSICLERFTQPKVLPCQHTFCLSCLRGIAKDDETLACPQCRVEHQLPKGGVQGLPDNRTIKSLLNMILDDENATIITIPTSPKAECSDCHRKASLNECQHCKESVCVICKESHEKLLEEIQRLLEVGGNDAKEKLGGKEESLDNLLREIAEKNAEVSEKFNEIRKAIGEKIDMREKKLSKFLDVLEKRISVVKSGKQNLLQEMNDELCDCKTTLSLKAFKHLLEGTENISTALLEHHEADLHIEIECDIECFLEEVVKVKLDDEVLATGSASDETSSQGKSKDSNSGREVASLNVLPTKVNYLAKEGTLKSIIEKHPDCTKTLVPEFAIYSLKLESIFCISENSVLVYPLTGADGGQSLSPTVTSCTHIAATDSGKLLVAEGPSLNIFDLARRHYLSLDKIGSATPKLEINLNNVKSVDQICCYLEEFAVLTANEKKIMVFSEEGKFIREFTVANINSGSRMTVDHEGQIYVTGEVSITEKTETGDMNGCPNHPHYRRHSQLRVTMSELQIHVYSWTGQFIITLQLMDSLTKTFDYKFDCMKCCGFYTRNDNSLPDDHIIKQSLRDIRGLCVDGDDFLSIAINNQINVYSQKPKTLAGEAISNEKSQLDVAAEAEDKTEKLDVVTSVGKHMTPGGGFEGELGGVSLMPDGRMLVCEKGGNRIVIL